MAEWFVNGFPHIPFPLGFIGVFSNPYPFWVGFEAFAFVGINTHPTAALSLNLNPSRRSDPM